MTAEKYEVKQGEKGVWSGFAQDNEQALNFCRADKPEFKESTDLVAEMVKETPEETIGARVAAERRVTTPRKPRADKGQPHKKAEKKVRNRGQFFIVSPDIRSFGTREELSQYLDTVSSIDQIAIVQGRRLDFQRKYQFTLKEG